MASNREFVPFSGNAFRLDQHDTLPTPSASASMVGNQQVGLSTGDIYIPSDEDYIPSGVRSMLSSHISMMQSMLDHIEKLMHENRGDEKMMDVLEQFALDATIHLSTIEQKANRIELGPESDIKVVELLVGDAKKFQDMFSNAHHVINNI